MNTEQINALIDHWCPEFSKESEPRDYQLIRAFMCATACARVQAEILAGKAPGAPLSMFPDPLRP